VRVSRLSLLSPTSSCFKTLEASTATTDSSQIKSNKPLLVIGDMAESGSTNPKSPSVVPDSTLGGLKRDLRNYHDGDDSNNLSIKKSKTTKMENNCREIVPLDVTPLSIVPPDTPKLSRQFWKAGDDDEAAPVPLYCN